MTLDFDKMNGLVPAIIQDADTAKVLMLGFMNKEAYDKTVETGKVTFFSRTKNRLWTKGEESGNFLNVVSIKEDCDQDTLLIQVHPVGPVCHTGAAVSYTHLDVYKRQILTYKNKDGLYASGSITAEAAPSGFTVPENAVEGDSMVLTLETAGEYKFVADGQSVTVTVA